MTEGWRSRNGDVVWFRYDGKRITWRWRLRWWFVQRMPWRRIRAKDQDA